MIKIFKKNGIEEGKKIEYMSILFRPIETKEIWENCAKIIVNQSKEKTSRYHYELLHWLENKQWPGYVTIRDRLRKMNCDFIYNAYSGAISKAYRMQDWIWVYWLTELLTIV